MLAPSPLFALVLLSLLLATSSCSFLQMHTCTKVVSWSLLWEGDKPQVRFIDKVLRQRHCIVQVLHKVWRPTRHKQDISSFKDDLHAHVRPSMLIWQAQGAWEGDVRVSCLLSVKTVVVDTVVVTHETVGKQYFWVHCCLSVRILPWRKSDIDVPNSPETWFRLRIPASSAGNIVHLVHLSCF